MPYTALKERGLAPFPCGDCGTPFWLRPASAQKVTASGKLLRCRDCADLKGFDVAPFPYCARLTEEEQNQYEWELEIERRNIENLKEATNPFTSLPLSPMSKTLTYPSEMEQLRQRLQNSLTASGTATARFCYKSKLPTKFVERFLSQDTSRLPRKDFVAKIEKAVKSFKWGEPVLSEVTMESLMEPMPSQPNAVELPTLSGRDKADVVLAIMSRPGSVGDNYTLLSRLLPADFPLEV